MVQKEDAQRATIKRWNSLEINKILTKNIKSTKLLDRQAQEFPSIFLLTHVTHSPLEGTKIKAWLRIKILWSD